MSGAKLVSRKTHFRGRIVTGSTEVVDLPNGQRVTLDIIHHPGGAAVVAVDGERRVCLLRQYRHAVGGWITELPAGKLEPGEPPLLTAQRELVEEAGVRATHWDALGGIVSSPGVLTETVHLFLATGLEAAPPQPEAGELLEIGWVPLAEARRRALDGEISDAKTCVGLLRAAERLGM
ncbi:MAG: ADP-ribose pyrophosphatase [Steroidobacteraceae bacterium]|nr:ADP-ribose pyrophosphatase [Steroidobacteraceae bacterium]